MLLCSTVKPLRVSLVEPVAYLNDSYKLFVPRPDQDAGLDVRGICTREVRVSLGTNTGWNVRTPGFQAPDLCELYGSYIPFAKTKAERLANGDPRRSLEERYRDHEGFVSGVKIAAKELIDARFPLPEDAEV